MSQAESPAVDFNEQLSSEAARVLADVIFTRAPTQRRLLSFLVERTISGTGPVTQFEIAVDCLGRGEDYYIDSDSYPRVQTSRLRRNLENYYARNLPGNGFKLVLEPGSYSLTLEHVPPASDEATVISLPMPAVSEEPQPKLSYWRVGLAFVVLAGLVSAPNSIGGHSKAALPVVPEKPFTALTINRDGLTDATQSNLEFAETASWFARIQLMKSWVSKPLPAGNDSSQAQYSVLLDFDQSREGGFLADLSVVNADGEALYSKGFMYGQDASSEAAADLRAALVSITSPTGVIAQAERPSRKSSTGSDYACFLAVENDRAIGARSGALIEDCLKTYPSSSYRSFWHAQKALATYEAEIAVGGTVEKSGDGWTELRAALDSDRYNAFANFAAAKVEIALGNCDEALMHVDYALEHGQSDPALVAAAEINAAACSASLDGNGKLADRMTALARFNPDPDPLLHLYLVVGYLAANDFDGARMVARMAVNADSKGQVAKTADLLKQSIEDRSLALENREQLEQAISLYVWDPKVTQAVVKTLVD